jgi:hypothetical protein
MGCDAERYIYNDCIVVVVVSLCTTTSIIITQTLLLHVAVVVVHHPGCLITGRPCRHSGGGLIGNGIVNGSEPPVDIGSTVALGRKAGQYVAQRGRGYRWYGCVGSGGCFGGHAMMG